MLIALRRSQSFIWSQLRGGVEKNEKGEDKRGKRGKKRNEGGKEERHTNE